MHDLVFTGSAKRQLEDLDPRTRRQVEKGLERLSREPRHGRPLRGGLRGIWSERVATFRILHKIQDDQAEVLVLVIEHRRLLHGGH